MVKQSTVIKFFHVNKTLVKNLQCLVDFYHDEKTMGSNLRCFRCFFYHDKKIMVNNI